MSTVGIKGYSYCLNHAPEMGLRYGTTPHGEHKTRGQTEFLNALPGHLQNYEDARDYAPNQAYIGGISYTEFEGKPQPWYEKRLAGSPRFGKFGEIMPEDEFLALMDICDVFDLIWLEKNFAAATRAKIANNPVITEPILARMKAGKELAEIEAEVKDKKALPFYYEGKLVGCTRSGHEVDENLFPIVLMENLASKAGGVLSLLHLLKNTGTKPEEIDFVIECSEEGAGDENQRAGGNFAKAIAEIAGCANASGCDVRGFCAGPANAVIAGACQVAAGARKNVAVVAGGAIPKLFMNARDHVKKNMPALEDCLGNFALLLVPDDGTNPVIRLDTLGKHTVAAGSSPQAVTTVLVYDPLVAVGLSFKDVDKFAAELQINEQTLPAGAGDVPLANIKMTAALAVMKKAIEKPDMDEFIKTRGVIGFAHTQGHIPSGVPFIGTACEMMKAGTMKRAMIIGKGSLFLARLTNLADGASFLIEPPSATASSKSAAVSKDESLIPKIGLMAAGSELGAEELARGARLALALGANVLPVMIGPKIAGFDDLEWIETSDGDAVIAETLEAALKDGRIAGAVALHFPFPLGVATIGRVLTPGRGRGMLIASTTGTSATQRGEAMLRNAIYGIAVAKALGNAKPTVGILNVDTAQPVFRALTRMKERGYGVHFGASVRKDGGAVLRGNDILVGAVDVCVADTLTGNVLMKMFSSFNSGGSYEAMGWGYGPSVGEGWRHVVSIISRASGAPVIAGALAYTATVVNGKLCEKVVSELSAAKRAGLDDEIAALTPKASVAEEEVKAPPSEPTDEEIHGIDVLEIENAVQCLWKAGIYAESAMGCTGPVVKLAKKHEGTAHELLKQNGFI